MLNAEREMMKDETGKPTADCLQDCRLLTARLPPDCRLPTANCRLPTELDPSPHALSPHADVRRRKGLPRPGDGERPEGRELHGDRGEFVSITGKSGCRKSTCCTS